MREKISVIVPVYGVEKKLARCVESILAQTYENIELVLVDDGSPDQCPAICDQYAEKYKNIVVIHKKNGGLTSAWKAGVTAATGDLLGFVDSDDWIDPDMYERLYETMERYDADLSMAGLVFDYEDKNYPPRREGNRLEQEFYDEQSWHALFPVLLNDGSFIGRTIQPSRVTKLFRRKYDGKYLGKIKLLRERLEAISDDKGIYDFAPQIRNDFLSLAVMAVKNEIWRNKKDSVEQILKNVRSMCKDPQVQEAVEHHTMNQIGISVKLYLFFIKHALALPCYLVTEIFFSLYYGIFARIQNRRKHG